MNISQLRAFHAVAVEGGFTRAAKALSVTQPTVSAQVRLLEESYGVRLFDRRGRSVRPTELGRALLAVTGPLFAREDEARALLAGATAIEGGHLRLGADGPHHAVPLLAALVARHPGLGFELAMGNGPEMLAALRDYQVDAAVLAAVPADPRLLVVAYARDPIVAVVPAGHPWAGRHGLALALLANEVLLVREEGSVTRRVVESALGRAGVAPRGRVQVESREGVREAAAGGLGIAMISAAEVGADARIATAAFADPGLVMAESVVCLAERRRLPVLRALMDLARERAGGARNGTDTGAG